MRNYRKILYKLPVLNFVITSFFYMIIHLYYSNYVLEFYFSFYLNKKYHDCNITTVSGYHFKFYLQKCYHNGIIYERTTNNNCLIYLYL